MAVALVIAGVQVGSLALECLHVTEVPPKKREGERSHKMLHLLLFI